MGEPNGTMIIEANNKKAFIIKLKIGILLLLVAYLFLVIAFGTNKVRILSPLLEVLCCLLILFTKNTQGHYRRISLCYAVGIGIWAIADICSQVGFYIPSLQNFFSPFSRFLFLIPNCFFALGLVFFTHSEYNFLHFQKMILTTFTTSFFTFLVVQKLILINWKGRSSINSDMIGTSLYFFVVVFTIVLVVNILLQTNFTGHTVGTYFSAAFLVVFNLMEMRMIYYKTISRNAERKYAVQAGNSRGYRQYGDGKTKQHAESGD